MMLVFILQTDGDPNLHGANSPSRFRTIKALGPTVFCVATNGATPDPLVDTYPVALTREIAPRNDPATDVTSDHTAPLVTLTPDRHLF